MAEKMTTCKACGKEIAKSAKVCPHCGAKQKNKVLGIVLLIAGILISVGACSSMISGTDNTKSETSSTTQEANVSSGNESVATQDTSISAVAEEATEQEDETTEVAESAEPSMTVGQKNAVRSAREYLKSMPFSRQGLIDQLSSEYGSGYTVEEAEFAVSYLESNNEVDWYEQAVKTAENYVDMMGFSRDGLIDQLSSDYGSKFTVEEAEYAADALGY